MGMVEVAAQSQISVPNLEKLVRDARVRFVDAQGRPVEVARALVTWKD